MQMLAVARENILLPNVDVLHAGTCNSDLFCKARALKVHILANRGVQIRNITDPDPKSFT